MSFHWLLEDGSGAWLLEDPPAAPTAPAAPTIGPAISGTASAQVFFTPNSNGGSPVTFFTATAVPGNTRFTGTSSPINCSVLAPGTYTFTVTATNAVNTSVPSGVSNAVTIGTPATAPGVPTIGTAVAGDGQASISYTPPASDGGSAITGYTMTSTPGGFIANGLSNPLTVLNLIDGTPYTFKVTATNAINTSLPSAASNSVTPVAATTVLVYANGVTGANFQRTPVLSFGCVLDYVSTADVCPGSTVSLQVATNTAFGGGFQPGSQWTTIPPNGFDDSGSTQLSFWLKTPTPSSMYVASHYSRSTGNDIPGASSWTQGSTCLNIPANTWTQITGPLSSLAMLGAKNEYKFVIGSNAANITFYVDNVKFLPGVFGWAFQGGGSPAAGWTDASFNLGGGGSADYTWLPQTLKPGSQGLYSLNNPPNAASQFVASASGTALTVSSITSGAINIGDTVCHDTSTPVGTILSGTFPNYVLSASAGSVASTNWASAPAQSTITGCKLTSNVVNGTLKLTHAGFSLTSFATLTFGVIPTKSGYGYQVQFFNTSGVAVGNAITMSSIYTQHDFGITTGAFTVYNVPLSAFGAIGQTIGGLSIKETSINTTNVTYFSAIGFTS